jgi:ribosomal protein S18 acetylase RimI-like enzyme
VVQPTIRPARAGDQASVVALDTIATHDPARADEITAWLAQGLCFCAEVEGVVAGYGVLQLHFFGRPFLEMLMVGEGYRSRGIGTTLIVHAARLAAGEQLWTSTNQSNQPMRRLLEHLGFTPSGVIEGLDEGDPELVFRLEPGRFHPPFVA